MYKQVIVIRKDINLSRGKAAAQAAHAALHSWQRSKPQIRDRWETAGAKKIVLAARGEMELKELYEKAKKAKLPCALIADAGLTEVAPGTLTALAIGPADEDDIDKLTGALPLLE